LVLPVACSLKSEAFFYSTASFATKSPTIARGHSHLPADIDLSA